MCHCSQAIASFFFKKNIEDNFPTTIVDLNICLEHSPGDKLGKQLMHFGESLHGTIYFWHKSKNELIDMISRLGFPTFFFKLSVVDTKFLDLHVLMLGIPLTDVRKQQHW
jgi:hypothetical protein